MACCWQVQYGKDTLFTTEAFIRIIEDIKESIAEVRVRVATNVMMPVAQCLNTLPTFFRRNMKQAQSFPPPCSLTPYAAASSLAALALFDCKPCFAATSLAKSSITGGGARTESLMRDGLSCFVAVSCKHCLPCERWIPLFTSHANPSTLSCRRIRSGIKTLSRKYQMHVYSHKLYRLRTAVRQLHSLASGFMLRQRFQHRFQALKLIQRAVRKFLQRCHAHWYRVRLSESLVNVNGYGTLICSTICLQVRAAILLQALWRGYVARSVHWNLVRVLRKRIQAKIVMLRIIRSQALWRGYTTRSKFQYLRWDMPLPHAILFVIADCFVHQALRVQGSSRLSHVQHKASVLPHPWCDSQNSSCHAWLLGSRMVPNPPRNAFN